ncbi:MAG: hypothetical protein NZ523_04395 [Elioraea sp.]|nr:hypothetical protein [Elioraea sp.]
MRLLPLSLVALALASPASADPWWGRHGKHHRDWGPPPVVVIPGYGPPPPVIVVPPRRPPPVVILPPGAYAYPGFRSYPAYPAFPAVPYGHFSFGLTVPFGR